MGCELRTSVRTQARGHQWVQPSCFRAPGTPRLGCPAPSALQSQSCIATRSQRQHDKGSESPVLLQQVGADVLCPQTAAHHAW